jgi:GNAT superfamily N-acetyltransferase
VNSVDDRFLIRRAIPSDIPIVAHHRTAMFLDMGWASNAIATDLAAATEEFLRDALPRGEYVGWLAAPASAPERIVGGVGAQLRRVLPFPRRSPDQSEHVAHGRQAIVINVYTEPSSRRQGVARMLMKEVLLWARALGLESLVLHATPEGRPLYEQLGFAESNEMRYTGELPR